MTRSVEIPDEAVEAAVEAFRDAHAEGVIVGRHEKAIRAVLSAALPYLAPAEPEDTRTDEERGFVEIALAAADSGSAGHWPTVAGYLADEVRRLRAAPAVPQSVDREALERMLETHGVFETTFISTERMESSRRILADAVLALLAGEQEQVEK